MLNLSAVYDFDRIQCLIMIDDGEDRNSSRKHFDEPKRFRIEVIGCRKNFVFEAPSCVLLR
jgi:hypothetical protein